MKPGDHACAIRFDAPIAPDNVAAMLLILLCIMIAVFVATSGWE